MDKRQVNNNVPSSPTTTAVEPPTSSTSSTPSSPTASSNATPTTSAQSPQVTSEVLYSVSTAAPTVLLEPCDPAIPSSDGQSCAWINNTKVTFTPATIATTTSELSGTPIQIVVVSYVSVFSSIEPSNIETTASAATSNSISGAASASSDTPDSASRSEGVSTAAVAGAAVGCFIAGALIATILAFLLFKRRSQRNRHAARSTYVPAPEPRFGGEKGTPLVAVAAVGGLDFLPQQADDAEVQRRLSTVIDQIDQHVENFYGNSRVPLNANLEAELSRFETSQLARPLAACFEHSANPTALIKHCLAFHIFNLTLAPGEGTEPLLPPDLAGTISAVYTKSLSPSASKDTLAAFSSWKALTKYLRPDLTRDRPVSRSTSESTSRIASHFTNIFSPWAKTQYSKEDRSRHLTEVINHSIQTAIWLFGQPDTFRFDWSTPAQDARQSAAGRNVNNVVLVPAVFKVTHNGARLGGNGQTVLRPVAKRF